MKHVTTIEILRTSLRYLTIGLLLLITIDGSITDASWVQAYTHLNWKLLLAEAIAIPVIAFGTRALFKWQPKVMGFGLVRLVNHLRGKPQPTDQNGNPILEGVNVIHLMGGDIKYIGVFVCLAMMTGLPTWAMIEEVIFRSGTSSLSDAVVRSLIFGFVHMAIGVPIVGAIMLSFLGMVLSLLYFQGGIALSTQAHFQLNFLVVSLFLITAVLRVFKRGSGHKNEKNTP